jgi:hypothetical protein
MSMLITNAGQSAVAQALADGTPITVTEVAFGTEDRHPTGGETALTTEVVRKPVLASGVDGQKTYFDARLEAEDGPYVLYEVGLFDDAGTLLFIGRMEGFNKLVLADQPITLDTRIHVLTSQFQNVVVQIDTSFAFVPATRRVDTGGGLAGGGDLSGDRTLKLDIGTLDAIAGADVDPATDTFALRDADDGGSPAHKAITTEELAKAVKAAAGFSHNHAIGDVTGLQAALDAKASGSHGHAIGDITNLQAALDAKAGASHGHAIGDVTGLQTALDAKAPKSSPAFTGNPTAPTQPQGNNSTRLATTAFVQQEMAQVSPDWATMEEAEAGVDETKSMHPLATAQAIQHQTTGPHSQHESLNAIALMYVDPGITISWLWEAVAGENLKWTSPDGSQMTAYTAPGTWKNVSYVGSDQLGLFMRVA